MICYVIKPSGKGLNDVLSFFPFKTAVSGRRGGSVVSASESREFEPWRCTHVVFLGKTLNSHSASLYPGV